MPYSRTHTLVRALQLSLATSIVITAAFLLTYRTRSHTNFTNEPLASCISGAVAFIYASWALMNHRRQPDSHRWIYLHAFWCFLVCGLLIAGSSLAFVLGKQGAPCQRIRDSREMFDFSNGSSHGVGSGSSSNPPLDTTDDLIQISATGFAAAGLPEYQDGMRYAPGQYCKNDHYMLDKACAILGAIAAAVWLIDFCLIFGFCGSSGQYGPYRRNEHHGGRNDRQSGGSGGMGSHQRRGQVGAEDYLAEEDYYPAGGQPPPMRSGNDNRGGGATIYNEQDQYYYDLLEQQKREFEWRENRTLDDPKGHVQGPIPLSMQHSYYPTAYPDNVVVVREATTTEGVMSPPVRMVIRDDFASSDSVVGMTVLSPPPRPISSSVAATRFVQPPDSPTLPGQEELQQQDQEGHQPQPLQLLVHAEHSIPQPAAIAPVPAPLPLVAPRTPRQKTPKQTATSRLQHQNSLPALELPAQHQFLNVTTPEESTSATSPRYVVYPPGPACYVFDSSQQEYLPSFVNMAARIEQKQHLKHSHSSSSNSRGSSIATAPAAVTSPGSPRHSAPSTPTFPPTAATGASPRSHRVMVTGLGMEAITRRPSEIEAERRATAIAFGSTDSLDTFDLTSSGTATSLATPTSPGLAATPTAVGNGRPLRIAMPSGGSYFPPPPETVGSPTGSLKSFTSRKSSDSHHSYQPQQHSPHHYLQHKHSHPHLHSPLGTEISNQVDDDDENDENDDISKLPPQPQQQAQGQVPLTKKPSLLKRKTSNLAIVTPQSPSSLHQPGSEGSSDLHSPSSPRSLYVGDF